MNYDPARYHRRSIRLKEYDYSQVGLYFITICTRNRNHLFGKIENKKMELNKFGEIAVSEWEKSEEIRDEIELHEYIVMPNHFHGIVEIMIGANGCSPVAEIIGANDRSPVGEIIRANSRSPVTNISGIDKNKNPIPKMRSKSISSLVSGYKSSVTKRINIIRGMPGEKLWQRNYWEHIIRNEDEYFRITNYIKNNPLKWNNDKLNGGKSNSVKESSPSYGEEIWMV